MLNDDRDLQMENGTGRRTVNILETERLIIRELKDEDDADFIFRLLNTPKFIQFIGDRNVHSPEDAHNFIRDRYRKSYQDHGYGLYAVELKAAGSETIGICGFVRRDSLPGPDIGFAFLPEYEGKGYGYEAASAMMNYGRTALGFAEVLAITTTDNDASGALLEKLGFSFDRVMENEEGETLKLFRIEF